MMLAVRNVSKQFLSGRGQVRALSEVSFSVSPGSGVFLAGRSGSGKTTLLNCIGTLETPDSGSVLYRDVDVCRLTSRQRALFRRREVGFVFQGGNLLPWLTVAENLAVPLELNGIYGGEQNGRIRELLGVFGLSGYERALPAELSGGEAQRISFARAIAHQPTVILADEPTAHLDSANGRQLVELMFSLCRLRGTILVIATHDRDLLEVAETIISLKDGRME